MATEKTIRIEMVAILLFGISACMKLLKGIFVSCALNDFISAFILIALITVLVIDIKLRRKNNREPD